MSKRSNNLSALMAIFALCAAGTWSGAQTVSVESRSVSPDEAFTINVNATGVSSVAGVNYQLTGMGSGLDASTPLTIGNGGIYNGHTSNTNVLSANNDARAVVYNSTTSTNLTGDGALNTISGRTSSTLANGDTIPFNFNAATSATSDASGNVLATTWNNGTLTISTPFPQTNPFTNADGNGWTFVDAGFLDSQAPEGVALGFGSATPSTPGGSIRMNNFGNYAFGWWQAPNEVAPVYRGNLVSHTLTLDANRTVAQIQSGVGPWVRIRSDDNTLFHLINEMVVDAGSATPTATPSDYVLVTERGDDLNTPVNHRPYFDTTFLRYNGTTPVDNENLDIGISNYTNARWSKADWEANKTPVISNFDLTITDAGSQTFDGTNFAYPYRPDLPQRNWASSPIAFFTESASNVWGFEKDTARVNDREMLYIIQKDDTTGATIQADTAYIAEFTVNSDLSEANVAMTPHFRVRVNTNGLAGNGLFYQQAWFATVNSFANNGSNFEWLPRAGAPKVIKVYMIPHPNNVGAGFTFAFDYNEVTDDITVNGMESRIWVSDIDLYAVPLSSISPIE